MKLRHIDIAAIIAALLLVKLTNLYTQGSESMEASIQLAFYSAWTSHMKIPDKDNLNGSININYDVARPVLLDVDGDGSMEALVVPRWKDDTWELQVLDLTPLRDTWAKEDIPFIPKVLFASIREDDSDDTIKPVPIKLITGQITLVERQEEESEIKKNDETNYKDTSQFYCGIDWHDAHTSCAIPCPNMSECPHGEFCFADTGCNRKESRRKTVSSIGGVHLEDLSKTPNEGLPTIVSVWSDGSVILYSILGKLGQPLEMVELWNVNILSLNTSSESEQDSAFIEFLELDVILDSELFGTFGTVFLAATYKSQKMSTEGNTETVVNDIYIALDAHDGTLLWRHCTQDQKGKKEIKSEVKTLSSIARRRSRASLYYPVVDNAYEDFEHSEDCFHHFHSNVMDASSHILPHSFWDNGFQYGSLAQDTKLLFSHFDRKHAFRNKSSHVEGKSLESKERQKRKGWIFHTFGKTANEPDKVAHHRQRRPIHYGHPNVLLHHNHLGVKVMALKNGKQVCHLALSDHTLYGDLQNDGIIDHLQVLFDVKRDSVLMPSERIKCEAWLQSGLTPAKDGSFVHFPLCEHYNTNMKTLQARHHQGEITSTESARPLLVEGFYDLVSTDWTLDIVYALNHGVLKRFDIHGGLIWSATGDIPSWDNSRSVLLDRINFEGSTTHGTSVSAIRPIILSGDDSFALFSSKHGRLLDKISFPQLSVSRPLLGDFDRDGTSDVIVFTTDGILGFKINIYSNKLTFMNIMNGFLFVMISLSVAYASFNKNDKRLKQL